MKYSRLMIASSLTLAASAATAAPTMTVFGIIDIGLGEISNKDSTGHTVTLKQERTDGLQSSRIGFTATQDIGYDSKVVGWLEAGLAPDTGTQASNNGVSATGTTTSLGKFWSRRTTLSLVNPELGELRLGRDFTPSFRNLMVFDPFGTNGLGAISNMSSLLGSGATTLARMDNSVTYFLPGTLQGVYGDIALAAAETSATLGPTQANNKHMGAQLGYSAASYEIGSGYGSSTITATGKDWKTVSFGGMYRPGAFRIEALYERDTYLNQGQDFWQLGGDVPFGKHDFRLSFIHSKQDGQTPTHVSTSGATANDIALGYIFNFTPTAAVYGTAVKMTNHGVAAFTLGGNGSAVGGSSTGGEVGVRYGF